jgi:beta-galactosidase
VGILVNRLSSMVGGAQSSLSKLGNAERDSLMGLHRAFFEEQIPVDFVHPDDVIHNRLGQYKVVFLPFPVMLSRNVGEGVARYIADGGTVVAEARLAWNDERGFSSDRVPGAGLDEVFGAREKLIRPVEKAKMFAVPAADLPGWGAGGTAAAEAFEEDLEPTAKARVLAKFANGEPAIVENRYGKGRAILIGSFPALSYQRAHEPSTKRLLLALARSAGISKEFRVTGAGTSEVEVRRLTSDRIQILFAFNHARARAEATIAIRLPWPAAKAQYLENDQAIPMRVVKGEALLQKSLAAGEIWIVMLKPA